MNVFTAPDISEGIVPDIDIFFAAQFGICGVAPGGIVISDPLSPLVKAGKFQLARDLLGFALIGTGKFPGVSPHGRSS